MDKTSNHTAAGPDERIYWLKYERVLIEIVSMAMKFKDMIKHFLLTLQHMCGHFSPVDSLHFGPRFW